MTRRMMSPGQKQFRVAVKRHERALNPDRREPGQPWFLYLETAVTDYWGPYNTIGAARSIQTKEAYMPGWVSNRRAELRDGVIETWIEQVVKVEWGRVDEQPE